MLEIGPRNNTIEFHLEVENTTLDKISSRLVVEVNNNITLIPLEINAEGVVSGDIELNESWNGKKGNLKLEIINENNYFSPFEKEVVFKLPKGFRSSAQTQPLPPIEKPTLYPEIDYSAQLENQSLIKESKTIFRNLDLMDLNSEIDNFFKVK
jgi:hypothetical protein